MNVSARIYQLINRFQLNVIMELCTEIYQANLILVRIGPI